MFSSTAIRPMRNHGFSLVELMVVVAIATILVTIAISGYSSSVRKSRRTDAKSALLDLAGREESYFALNNGYATLWSQIGYKPAADTTPTSTAIPVGNSYYNVTITVAGANNSTFTITAVPVTVDQLKDTQCLTFSLTNTGVQTATNASCWS